jgi:NAD(P)-dependent dehydrogenase (short-subunit alcohol dehydrogenase family)
MTESAGPDVVIVGPAVVITGASTGIGRACALDLARRGFSVFAGVRREVDADGLTGEDSRINPVILDVTDAASIAAAAARVSEAVGARGLAGLVNNAGVAVSGPLEYLPLDELRRQLEINLVGQVAVTQAFLPLLRRARGRVVNVGSIGGRVALPFLGPYAASKFAMEGLSDSLRRELAPLGVGVSVVRPGAIATSIWESGNAAADEVLQSMPREAIEIYGEAADRTRAAAQKRADGAIPASAVADVVRHALTAERPRTRYLVGRTAKVMATLAKVLPDRAMDALIARSLG